MRSSRLRPSPLPEARERWDECPMTRRRAAPSLAARKMLKLTVTAETSATPEQVLAGAGTDFSAHRAKVWPNVTVKRLELHELGDSYAEVTEGATGIAWFAW